MGWGGEDWLWRQPQPDLHPNATLPEVTTSKPHCLCRQFRDSEPFLAVLELGGSGGRLAVTHFQMPGKRQACDRPSKVSAVRRAVLAHHATAHPHPIHHPPPTQRCGHTWTLSIHPNSSNPESHAAVRCFGVQLVGGVAGRGGTALPPAWSRTPGLESFFLSFISCLLSVPSTPSPASLDTIIHHLSCKSPQVPGSSCELPVLLPGRNFSCSVRIRLSTGSLSSPTKRES